MKIGYKIVISDENLKTKEITAANFKDFQKTYPKIAEILLNPDKLMSDQNLLEQIQLDSWQSTAFNILTAVWKFKGAKLFHTPVNPEKLGI